MKIRVTDDEVATLIALAGPAGRRVSLTMLATGEQTIDTEDPGTGWSLNRLAEMRGTTKKRLERKGK